MECCTIARLVALRLAESMTDGNFSKFNAQEGPCAAGKGSSVGKKMMWLACCD